MTFRRRVRLDPRQVRDLRGRSLGRGGAALLGGGGSIGIIILLVFVVLGGDISSLLGGGLGSQTGPVTYPSGGGELTSCETGEDANERRDCRIVGFVNSAQAYWDGVFARSGLTYEQALTTLFTGSVRSACGLAAASTGPFYCPLDRSIYLDLSFFDDMLVILGARGGPLAEGYVIAHEYGHHVQNELGELGGSRQAGAGGASVLTELQADCYAGAWAAGAAETGFLEPPTAAQIAIALDAAAAVGDDRIQQRRQGEVDPHTWTHGSSEQRQDAFLLGYESRDLGECQDL